MRPSTDDVIYGHVGHNKRHVAAVDVEDDDAEADTVDDTEDDAAEGAEEGAADDVADDEEPSRDTVGPTGRRGPLTGTAGDRRESAGWSGPSGLWSANDGQR